MYERIFIYEYEMDLRERISLLKENGEFIGIWKEGNYSYLFFKADQKAFLQQSFIPFRSETILNYEDWEAGFPLDILRVGRFAIHPPWKPLSQGEGIPLTIDPAVAFGSGYHASTRGCLILLEKLFEMMVPERVLDLGTGTGILSIAALKLGAKSSMALDYNNLAIETARRNRAINGMNERMHLWVGEAQKFLHLRADLLIANLYFQLIDELTDQEIFYSKPYYLLSGLLGHEGQKIQEKLQKKLVLLDSYEEDLWSTFLYRHPSLTPARS